MSNNTTDIGSNTALVKFNSDYEYVLGATKGRLLEIAGMFHSGSFLDRQIDQIREDLEATAKMYAEQQGLAPGMPGWSTSEFEERINTGTLYNGIKAVRTGQTIRLRSEAKDKYGHYYGGHVEFGHQGVPARPHLRPALYTVSEASKGKLRSALHNLFAGAFNGSLPMTFGTGGGLSASYYRNGPGRVTSYLTKGTRAQQMKYHFGSIRQNTGGRKGISRKASAFRENMSRTASKSMKWGKQKALSPAQRASYARKNSSTYRKLDRQRKATTRNVISHRNLGTSKSYSQLRNKGTYPVQRAQANNYNSQRYQKENSAYKQQKHQQNLARKQYNNYYTKGEGAQQLKTSPYSYGFMQAKSNSQSKAAYKASQSITSANPYKGRSANPFRNR